MRLGGFVEEGVESGTGLTGVEDSLWHNLSVRDCVRYCKKAVKSNGRLPEKNLWSRPLEEDDTYVGRSRSMALA